MIKLTCETVQDGTPKSANTENLQRERGAKEEEKKKRGAQIKWETQECSLTQVKLHKEYVLFIQQILFVQLPSQALFKLLVIQRSTIQKSPLPLGASDLGRVFVPGMCDWFH